MGEVKAVLDAELIAFIERWCRDFEVSQPRNVMIDEDTFEGSAYYCFQLILASVRS